jgi:hypothetical protein
MSSEYHILNTPKPLIEDYKGLKEEGLAFIQKTCIESWTNLNSTDPGVTILEQVCFALTELGYCSQFPIEDILTNRDDKIDFHNQFYHPDKILTISPVTINDYIKFIVDQIPSIDRLVISAARNFFPQTGSIFKTKLPPMFPYLDKEKLNKEQKAKEKVFKNVVWFALNKARNLDQIFQVPEFLNAKLYELLGNIEIDKKENFLKVIEEIEKVISNYIFPKVQISGYKDLVESGDRINEIFNGPILKNGWISDDDIFEKKDKINSDEITRLIQDIKGVKSVNEIRFKLKNSSSHPKDQISCSKGELLIIDVFKSDFNVNGTPLTSKIPHIASIGGLMKSGTNEELQNQINSTIDLSTYPKGSYRDINEYYSIQNTFPEIFGVGETSVNPKNTQEGNGQIKQLKAYLTLYDQILANQFSQLANVDNLFSFKNSTTGTPSDEVKFYRLRNQTEREQLKYPVPYKCFAPTYFYQSLYKTVPNIRPLLRNNESFNFDLKLQNEKVSFEDSWDEYKDSPYNSYVHGLMDIVEDPKENLLRRNAILDHLLARHGESPEVIDQIINGTVYSGSASQDSVILKSALLRNLDKISYYKQKGYNFLSATEIKLNPKVKKENTFEKIIERRNSDFIFNTDRFEKQTDFKDIDFVNYSTVEILVNLLFGLSTSYENFIIKNNEEMDMLQEQKKLEELGKPVVLEKSTDAFKIAELQQVIWFLQERKGFILIEKSMLYRYAQFEIFYKPASDKSVTYHLKKAEYFEMVEVQELLDRVVVVKGEKDFTVEGRERNFQFTKYTSSKIDQKFFKNINDDGDELALKAFWGEQLHYLENPSHINGIICIFPTYINDFKGEIFQSRLQIFFNYFLPVQIKPEIYKATADHLEQLIPAFTTWHNEMIYKDNVKEKKLKTPVQAEKMVTAAKARKGEPIESQKMSNTRKLVSKLMEIKLMGVD